MAVQTHDSSWRVLVAAAPMLGIAFMVLAAVQGEPENFKSRNVYMVLAAFAGLGCIVAAWTAQRLRGAVAGVTVAIAVAAPQAVRQTTRRGRCAPVWRQRESNRWAVRQSSPSMIRTHALG